MLWFISESYVTPVCSDTLGRKTNKDKDHLCFMNFHSAIQSSISLCTVGSRPG